MKRASSGIGILAATLLLTSCGSPAITATPTKQPPQSVQMTPFPEISEQNVGEEVLVTGVVTEALQEPRPLDAGEWVTLKTEDDEQLLVMFVFSEGPFPACVNEEAQQVGRSLKVGDNVEVFGRILADGQITTCDSIQYYFHLMD